MHDFVSYLFYLLQRGMCDVDDLFTNTLGAMLGWCAVMFVLALRQKSRTWPRYCALPAAFALALSAIFISYAAQPYGNLRDAAFTTADLSAVRWSVDFALDEDSKTAWVYRSQALDNADADRFAAEFAAAHGVEFPDIDYYDDTALYMNHSTGDFLNVTLHDGTWEYSLGKDITPVWDIPPQDVSEALLRETLDGLGFLVPADATFTLLPYGSSYRAVCSADLLPTEGGFLHGTLTCDLRTQGDGQSTLSQLENRITTLAPVREEPILSPAQALAALQAGKSFEGAWFAQSVQGIEVRSCTLDYLSDSKGFYQPVYRFELSLAGQAGGITDAVDYVPALF